MQLALLLAPALACSGTVVLVASGGILSATAGLGAAGQQQVGYDQLQCTYLVL